MGQAADTGDPAGAGAELFAESLTGRQFFDLEGGFDGFGDFRENEEDTEGDEGAGNISIGNVYFLLFFYFTYIWRTKFAS